ncbi:MAG: hypothetical protein GY799_25365 [Desulfobulbaceae bacterium]|nr:hypothetical protein [Desulfobulbaceae bacterium]
MATYTATINTYDTFHHKIANGEIDLDTDEFLILLTTSTHTPAATDDYLDDIDNEVTGNGYARETLASVTWTETGGVATFDFTDPTWTASGGSIVARNWHMVDNTPVGDGAKPLCFWGLLDDSVADVTITNGNTLEVNINASGLFTLSTP